MYTNLNRKGWGYVNKNRKPGPPKPKNMGKTLKTLMKYLGKYKALLAIVMLLVIVNSFAKSNNSSFL